MDTLAVGRRVAERQRALDLTGEELSKRLGCSPSHLSRVKAGKAGDLKYDTIRAWAEILGVTPVWLAEGEAPDVQVALSRLASDPDIGSSLATISVWFDTTTEHDREVFRHVIRKFATLLNRRDTRIKEISDRDLVEFEELSP